MSILTLNDDTLRVDTVRCTDSHVIVCLKDGREIRAPLWWYPRLYRATPAEREVWAIMPFGDAIEWEAIDEHIGVKGLLTGGPAPGAEPPASRASHPSEDRPTL